MGQVPPVTPKDALNSCGEGNLGRSAQYFYFLLLAPVEEPPATSQLLTCIPYSYIEYLSYYLSAFSL